MSSVALDAARLASRLPRGGFPVVRAMASVASSLRAVKLKTDYGPVVCDLAESVCFPLLKYGRYPHWNLQSDDFAGLRLPPDAVIFDVGANIGVTVLIFARIAKHVHAFEPAPRALAMLRRNAAALDNVTIHEVAVGASSGTVFFEEYAQLDNSRVASHGIEVPSVRLDALGISPDLIKMDVEGFEDAVLEGCYGLLREGVPIFFEAKFDDDLVSSSAIIQSANPQYQILDIGSGSRNFLAQTPDRAIFGAGQ